MPINREILRLAIPNIISNVSVPLLSTVDTALMGHLSQAHLGAVGIGSMIFNFIYWNFGFLRMGTTGLTAQAFGAADDTAIGSTLGRSALVAMGLGLLLWLCQWPLEWASLQLLQVDAGQTGLVSEYFRIRIWAAPASLLSYVVLGWLFGMQNALYPLYLTIVVNVVNIGLSFLLIIRFNMGIAGVAWGTVIAQYVGLIVGVSMLAGRYRPYLRAIRLALLRELAPMRNFFRLNVDLFLRTLCLTFVFAFFYSESSASGPLVLAVNVVLLQMVNWMSYGVDGFAFAAESLVGKYKGRQDLDKLNKTISLSMVWGLGLAASFALLYALWGQEVFSIFTDQEEVIAASVPFMIYMILFPLLGFLSYIWDGIYIGLTASRTMRNAMLFSLIAFLVLHFSLKAHYGNHGLWIAMLLFLLVRGLSQSVLYRMYGWKLR